MRGSIANKKITNKKLENIKLQKVTVCCIIRAVRRDGVIKGGIRFYGTQENATNVTACFELRSFSSNPEPTLDFKPPPTTIDRGHSVFAVSFVTDFLPELAIKSVKK